jgi:predicted MPP superfamily phosphohydrolase
MMKKIPIKNLLLLLLLFFALVVGVAIYAHWVEPIWIEVTHHKLKAPVKSPLRIAHLTDLHIKKFGFREKRLLKLLKQESPDAILISGDSISNTGDYHAVGIFLKELVAPRGVWLVRGNWEHWRSDRDELQIYANAGIQFLNNSNRQISENIWIIGLDDNSAGSPDLAAANSGVPKGAYKIGLFHSPDYFSEHAEAFDLALAGHTHGGQIRLPFFPPLWLPRGSGPYVKGWYTAQNSDSKMYVSRGIGNSILELRFFCRPELPIVTITPE